MLKFNHLCCKLIFSDFRENHNFEQFFKRSKLFFRFIASLSVDNDSPCLATVLFWSFAGHYSKSLMRLSIKAPLSGDEIKKIEMLLIHAGKSLDNIKSDRTYSKFGSNGGRVYMGMAILVSAIYSYRKDHGRFPASAKDLVPTYMNNLPLDYFAKKNWDSTNDNLPTIKYYLNNSQWYLKSFGGNYKDDNYTPEKALADPNPVFHKKDYIVTEKTVLDF